MAVFDTDAIRDELGQPSTSVISDDTIYRLIDEEQTFYGTAARAAELVRRYYAQKAKKSLGDKSIDYSGMMREWSIIVKELRTKQLLHAKPYAGGIDDPYDYDFKREVSDGDDH